MQVKDKQFLVNIFNRVSASVVRVNEKIIAHQQNKLSVENLQATVALEQLAMQHEMLIALAMLVFDPGTGAMVLPDLPKKIMGFN